MATPLLTSPANVHRAITIRYAISLTAIALLSLLGWGLMTAQLGEHRQQDKTISLAGAQRMLSHQIAGLVAEQMGEQDETRRARATADLNQAEQQYMAAYQALSEGQDGKEPPSQATKDLRAIYFDGPGSVAAATARIRDWLSAVEHGRMSKADTQAFVAWMRGPLIRVLDHAVAAHRTAAIHTLNDLQVYHIGDLAAVLLVLALEAGLIFAPLARRLAIQTTEMQRQSRRLVETSEELERLASTDGLTRLANRRALDSALAQPLNWIEDAPQLGRARAAGSVGVLSFDLDCFKQVNDVYGHAAGDEVLRAVGERLRAACRAGDLVARMGGDEFTAILYDVPSAEYVELIAERIRASVGEPVPFDGAQLKVGASIGTCLVPDQAATLQEALRKADAMQREVKKLSKSRSGRRKSASAMSYAIA